MFKVIQLNCRGYHGNRHLIAEVLRAEDPDVLLLNNTGILPTSRSIRHYGYTTQVTHAHTPHNGVAILVKTHIKHEFYTTWASPDFLAVKIHTHRDQILIATTYARPNAGLPYADLNSLFNHTNIPVYLIADLNAKHTAYNHAICDNQGRQLFQITERKRLKFLGPDFATCFTHNGTGRPDLAFTNRQSLHLHHHLTPGNLCGSDHIPLILRISTNPIAIPSPPHFNYKRADWDAFRDSLADTHTHTPLENQHHSSIDTYIENINTNIMQAANTHIPKTRFKIFIDFRPSIRTQRLLVCYQTRFEQNKHRHTRIQGDLNILRRHILDSLNEDHQRHWQQILTDTQVHRTTNPTEFWRKIYNLRGITKTPFQYLNINNTRISDPPLVAEAFKNHWQQIFQPHPLPPHAPTMAHIDNITDHMLRTHRDTQPLATVHNNLLLPDHILTTPIEEEEVERLLRRTHRRAPGPTGITWAITRQLPRCIIKSLTKVYNASLAAGYFPMAFKTATTILIPKPQKSPRHPGNYRPISLLDILGKTFERLINARLRMHLDFNDLLSHKQLGFRQNCSTEDALNTITAYLHCNNRFKCALVTKDVKQAFDTVWHIGLKYKICTHFDLPPITQKLLCSFLDNRQMRIRHRSCLSTLFTPLAGVPQGSVLSPTLFNMYTHDLPDPTHTDSLTIQYADDVTQLARARSLDRLTDRLQIDLTTTSLWELKWRIASHPDKTAVTYFSTKKSEVPRRIYLYPFLPNQTPIRRSNTNKVLGVTFDKNLCFLQHITTKVGLAKNTLSNLSRFRGSSARTKMHLYKALIRPVLTYCPLVASLIAKTNHIKLQTIQNKALRFVLDTRWYDFRTAQSLHEECNLPPLNITIHNRITKQLEKFRITHTQLFEFINTLPPYSRTLRPSNLLDAENHVLPEPVYVYAQDH